jgi:hypothetical protein
VLQNEPTPTDTDTERPGDVVDGAGVTGQVSWVLTGPDGEVKESGTAHNTITQVGDQLLGERAVGITTLGPPNGMKLGTGSTAAAKTGAGAALGATYLTGSNVVFNPATPVSTLNGALRQIRFTGVWAAGVATTASPITEAVIVNDQASNATSTAANTYSRVILNPAVGSKGTQDSLTLTWDWNVGT